MELLLSLLRLLVPVICMYASLWWHKFDLIIEVFNSIWLLMLHVSRHPSYISTPFLVLNLDGRFAVSSNKFFLFYISLLYYSILRSLLIYFTFSREIYISLSTPSTFVAVSDLFCDKVIATFVISSTVLFQFGSSFKWTCSKLFNMINKFLVLFTIYLFTYILTNVSTQIFSKRQKIIALTNILSWTGSRVIFYMLYID